MSGSINHALKRNRKFIDKHFIHGIATAAVKESKPSELKSEKDTVAQYEKQMGEALDHYLGTMHEGFDLIVHKGKLPKTFSYDRIRDIIKNPKHVAEDLAAGKLPYELCGLKPDDVVSMYSVGYACFEDMAYREAQAIFALLSYLDPFFVAGWKGLGMSLERQNLLKEAAWAYLMAVSVSDEDNELYLWAVQCLLRLGLMDEAKKVVQFALEETKDDPKHKQFHDLAKQIDHNIR